jgi:hypothetical protein
VAEGGERCGYLYVEKGRKKKYRKKQREKAKIDPKTQLQASMK